MTGGMSEEAGDRQLEQPLHLSSLLIPPCASSNVHTQCTSFNNDWTNRPFSVTRFEHGLNTLGQNALRERFAHEMVGTHSETEHLVNLVVLAS
jgi:hypothetical protein